MVQESVHLSEIMNRHNQTANLQVVFTDVEKYSKRRTQAQVSVIDALTSCMKDALTSVSKRYLDYAQANNLNFQTDIISLPTGDGAATVFSFDGVHDIHLNFALSLLECAYLLRQKGPCTKFDEEGWCNCHPYFNLRIGISEGKGILFRDLRDQFNVAGSVVNLAARVMGLADRNQIIFTEDAYRQIIDMIDDPHFVDLFVEFSDIELKHDLQVKVYQFIDRSLPFLSTAAPEELTLKRRMMTLQEKMQTLTSTGSPSEMDKVDIVEFSERLVDAFSTLWDTKAPLAIDLQAPEEPSPKKLDKQHGE